MISRTLARLTVSSLAALTLVACQDGVAPLARTPRDSAPRFSQSPTEQLDQQNLTSNNWAIEGNSGFGQSFTAGKTGELTTIEVQVTCGESMPDAVMVVYAGTYHGNTPAPNVAALIASQPVSSSVWPSCNPAPSTQTWISVAFDTPASVVAGAAYTFRMIYSTGRIHHNVSSFSDLYSGGVMWAFATDWDMLFKTFVTDPTPPVIIPLVSGTVGNDGWYTSNVTVSWTVADGGSVISTSFGCGSTIVNADNAGATFTCSATSSGGTASQSVTVKRDATAPTLDPSISPSPVLLNGNASAAPNANDAGSGLASASCGAVVTSSVGANTVACTATDNAGNQSSLSAPYSVSYAFTGFFAPVDAAPTLNSTKAGSAIPVKFSLGGNQGLAIMATDFPASQPMSCTTSAPTDDLEETVIAGGSSLTYDALSDRYTYVWKTDKLWAGSCRTLTVKLTDGTEHTAYFKFTK